MKCPICGCKMKQEIMCPYCKITGDQVKLASNKEAKKRIKQKDTKEVYNSTYMPKDVNRTRLMLVALFGGLFGAHQFYVGKYKWGLFYSISVCLSLIAFAFATKIYPNIAWLSSVADIFYMLDAIVLMMWMSDFFKICFKNFSIPVVLGEEKYVKGGKK